MEKGNRAMKAATGLLIGVATMMSSTGASATDTTPSAESLEKVILSPAENEQAAALGRQDTIVVMPDNLDWAEAIPTTLKLPFHVEIKTSKLRWVIKNSLIQIGVAPIESAGVVGACCGKFDHLAPNSYATSLEEGEQHHLDKDVWWQAEVGDNTLATRARNACRNLRTDMEHQGLSQDEIFGEDRETVLSMEFRLAAQVVYQKVSPAHFNSAGFGLPGESGVGDLFWKQSQSLFPNLKVVCKRRDGFQNVMNPAVKPGGGGDLAMGFQVNQAALAITPKHYAAKCPAKLHLNPTIEATGAGTVRYRFVDQLGNKSQEFQVKFTKSDVKFLDHTIEIDGKGKPKGLGFAAAQPQGGAFGLVAPNDPNLTQGYFQLEVLAPHAKLSNIADYSVKCTVQTAGDDLVAPPDVVNPVIVEGLTAAPKLPDLVIEQVQPSPATPTKVFVKVTNRGIAASTPTNLKALRYVGDQATAHGTLVPAVQPGQSQVVLAELGGTIAGASEIYLRVDDPDRIVEGDESNNSVKMK